MPYREEYKLVSRTLCPVENYKTSLQASHLDVKQRLFVDVSTSSPSYVNFTVKAEFENDFLLKYARTCVKVWFKVELRIWIELNVVEYVTKNDFIIVVIFEVKYTH